MYLGKVGEGNPKWKYSLYHPCYFLFVQNCTLPGFWVLTQETKAGHLNRGLLTPYFLYSLRIRGKKVKVLVAHSCLTLCNPMDYKPARLLCSRAFPGKNTGVDSHSLLLSIFLIKGSNLCLLYHRQILYRLSHPGSPIIRGTHIKSVRYHFPRIIFTKMKTYSDSLC